MPRSNSISRRDFVAGAAAAAALPVSLVELAFARTGQNFTFAYLSDAHIQHIQGGRFVADWDRGLGRAVAETNHLNPRPDFAVFGGDLAQLATRAELDHGAALLAKLRCKTYHVIGEHDYYLDLGEYWSQLFGPQWYSFDHKGVHFVVLNSILTHEEWTFDRWPTGEQRMAEMAGLDNPNGSPFMVGEKQRAWLARDLARVSQRTPVVVFSHAPLQKIHRGWNFWTEDAEQVQALLAPFEQATVMYGHVHQMQHNRIGNTSFHAAMATAWPWPYPHGAARAGSMLPKLTVPLDCTAQPGDRRGSGWQLIDVNTGNVAMRYNLHGPVAGGVMAPGSALWRAPL